MQTLVGGKFINRSVLAIQIVTCSDDSKQKVFRIKRTDPDDLDASLLVRGRAEPVDQEVLDRCQQNISMSQFSIRDDTRSSGALPPAPKTPSSSRSVAAASAILSTPARGDQPSTSGSLTTPHRSVTKDSATPFRGASSSALAHSSRKLLSTPRHLRPARQESPMTPSSVDRSVSLLQWLSSAKKTPKEGTDTTPRAAEASVCVSASKKAGIKRKLTEVMEDRNEDAENMMESTFPAVKRAAISPSKNILINIFNEDSNGLSSNAAKMLKYEDKESKPAKCNLEKILDEDVQPFDSNMLDTLLHNSFRSSFGESKNSVEEKSTNIIKPNIASIEKGLSRNTEPLDPVQYFRSKFDSPTANLPNFVLDGTSPRVRPTPVFKPQPDWLSSLSKQRQLRATPEGKEKKSKKSFYPKSSTVRGSKKLLEIVALTDSPGRDARKSAQKTTQTKLKFRS